jgi:hypothetical protein
MNRLSQRRAWKMAVLYCTALYHHLCGAGGGGRRKQKISLRIFSLLPEFQTIEDGITGFLGFDIFSGNSVSFRL